MKKRMGTLKRTTTTTKMMNHYHHQNLDYQRVQRIQVLDNNCVPKNIVPPYNVYRIIIRIKKKLVKHISIRTTIVKKSKVRHNRMLRRSFNRRNQQNKQQLMVKKDSLVFGKKCDSKERQQQSFDYRNSNNKVFEINQVHNRTTTLIDSSLSVQMKDCQQNRKRQQNYVINKMWGVTVMNALSVYVQLIVKRMNVLALFIVLAGYFNSNLLNTFRMSPCRTILLFPTVQGFTATTSRVPFLSERYGARIQSYKRRNIHNLESGCIRSIHFGGTIGMSSSFRRDFNKRTLFSNSNAAHDSSIGMEEISSSQVCSNKEHQKGLSVQKTKVLGLLTFDLDDTLFSMDETLQDANVALIQKMNDLGISTDLNRFGQMFKSIREQYRSQSLEPISYTQVRKLAIEKEIIHCISNNNDTDSSLKHIVNDSNKLNSIVNSIFDAWLLERHNAAERYLFHDTISTFQDILNKYNNDPTIDNNCLDLCIGAITNGRGDPFQMPLLEEFFDFCVSGEDEDVYPHRKPSPVIYEKALKLYNELYPHHQDVSSNMMNINTNVTMNFDNNEDEASLIPSSGPSERIWVHVGDCLINDVGASASIGAYAVWYNPKGIDDKKDNRVGSNKPLLATQITKLSDLPLAIDKFIMNDT